MVIKAHQNPSNTPWENDAGNWSVFPLRSCGWKIRSSITADFQRCPGFLLLKALKYHVYVYMYISSSLRQNLLRWWCPLVVRLKNSPAVFTLNENVKQKKYQIARFIYRIIMEIWNIIFKETICFHLSLSWFVPLFKFPSETKQTLKKILALHPKQICSF